MRRQLRRRHRGKGVVEAMVDFVGNEPDAGAFRSLDQAGKRLPGHHRAGGIGRASDQHALQRRPAMGSQQGFAGQRVAIFARRLDQHRLATERAQDVPVRGIAGNRDRHPVARLEQGQKGQDEGPRGSRGDDDSLRIHGATIGLAIVPGDARPQGGGAERRGIVDPGAVQRGVGAGAQGCPTSMWMTWPPEASIRAAAAITSITMNGGTSLRPDGVSRFLARSLSVASSIDIC